MPPVKQGGRRNLRRLRLLALGGDVGFGLVALCRLDTDFLIFDRPVAGVACTVAIANLEKMQTEEASHQGFPGPGSLTEVHETTCTLSILKAAGQWSGLTRCNWPLKRSSYRR